MASKVNSGGSWGNAAPPVMSLPGGRVLSPWLALTALLFGFFMSLLDATIVNIALTNIQTDLNGPRSNQ